MADVSVSESCCHLESSGGGRCLLTGRACPFAEPEHRRCEQSGFVAHVTLPPDEFKVVLDRRGVPKVGPLVVRKCREEFTYHGAGVYVNAVLGSAGDDAKLEIEAAAADQRVELVCRSADVRLLWTNGRFAPL